MRRLLLAIDQRHVALLENLDEMEQGDLRSVVYSSEHRFSEKHSTDRDSVQSSRELTVDPCFDRMCIAESMQPRIRLDHRQGDPRAAMAVARRRAGFDHQP